MRKRHHPRSYGRLSTAAGATRRVALLPRIRRVAEHHALRGGGHGVFRRSRATEDVDTGGLEHVDEVCPGFDRHALAQTGAEFDLAGLFMPEDVFDEKGHAVERSIAQPRFVKSVNAVIVGFDNSVDDRVPCLNRFKRCQRQLTRGHLFFHHEFSKSQAIILCVLCKIS